jgi:putative nucleotidyltransferase with HDIG domain
MNFEDSKKYFEEFLSKHFDMNDEKITHKMNHTYNVVENARYLSKELDLDEENTNLALIIALLHDIGRFVQATTLKTFREDTTNFDHATLGVKLLFDENEIVNYVKDKKYYPIIKKAIGNHSKYILDESDMTKEEILHCKIIRDADKLDSFRAKTVDDVYTMANVTPEEIENSKVTEKTYNTFKEHKTILSTDRETALDIWVSYIAFIYGLEFKASYKLINKKDYLNKLFNRFTYKVDNETMNELKKVAFNYLNEKLNQ